MGCHGSRTEAFKPCWDIFEMERLAPIMYSNKFIQMDKTYKMKKKVSSSTLSSTLQIASDG